MPKIEFDEKCKSCGGTGLYVGMAERDGVAVVCHTCKGTGKHHFVYEYEEFAGRIFNEDVKRVVKTNPGIGLGEINGDITWVGGMTYEEWLEGNKFIVGMEMRQHTCPCWWYQSADYKNKPNWNECGWGSFSSCKNFSNKQKCWERWDKEFGDKV